MNRDHKVFTVVIKYDATVRVPNPEAPGSGEMVNAGRERITHTVVVIATDIVIVKAWLIENPFRFQNVELVGYTSAKIDAVIETHTF